MDKRIAEFEARLRALVEEFSDITPMYRAKSSASRRTYLIDFEKRSEAVGAHLDAVCRRLGFPVSVVGMEFEAGGGTFRVIDVKTRAPKYPMICLNTKTGERYKFPVSRVRDLLGGDKMINRTKSLSDLAGNVL